MTTVRVQLPGGGPHVNLIRRDVKAIRERNTFFLPSQLCEKSYSSPDNFFFPGGYERKEGQAEIKKGRGKGRKLNLTILKFKKTRYRSAEEEIIYHAGHFRDFWKRIWRDRWVSPDISSERYRYRQKNRSRRMVDFTPRGF